jgi:hypothetical protein
MAFNGTTNFRKQEIVSYLESIGMRFGADLNAYTSFDNHVENTLSRLEGKFGIATIYGFMLPTMHRKPVQNTGWKNDAESKIARAEKRKFERQNRDLA